MQLLSSFPCSPHSGDADSRRKVLLVFDLAAFIFFVLTFIYYNNFYQPQWLTNEGVLLWESSNTRPLIFLYIYIVFFVTTRLALINLIGPEISPAHIIPTGSKLYVNAHWPIKLLLFCAFSYISFTSVFLPYFNSGFGSTIIIGSLDSHLTALLAPLSQYLEHGKILYLETPTQYGPGILYLIGKLTDIFSLTLADAYRIQLLLNLITLVAFCGFIVILTGPLFGSIIFLSAFSAFSILYNFAWPGWGLLHRWMLIPIFSVILARILTTDSKPSRKHLKLVILGMAWSLFAIVSQEMFGGGIISYSLVFILLLRFRTCTLKSYIKSYLLFIATFATTFFVLIGCFFGFDRVLDFFSLYTEYSGRVFAGASSLFFTDTQKLANNTSGLIFVGIIFLGVPILAAAIHLISTAQANQFYMRDIAIFAAIIASATGLNLISYLRSDSSHIQSSAFMMVPMFAAYIIFYLRWAGERSTFTTMTTFIAALLTVAVLYGSHHQVKRYLIPLLTLPDTHNLTAWLQGQPKSHGVPSLSPFGITPNDSSRNEAYRFVIGRYSSLKNEQDWAVKHYAKGIARQAEIRLALGDREVVPTGFYALSSPFGHLPYNTVDSDEGDFFLTGLRSATNIISPTTSVWTDIDLRAWQSASRDRDELCISTRVPNNIRWLARANKVPELRIKSITTASTFAGESTTFLCKCAPSNDDPGCQPVQHHSHEYLTQVTSDFFSIKNALDHYYSENGYYPASSKKGSATQARTGWDGLYSNLGESKSQWIQGLTPSYISELPRDQRDSVDGSTNYIYKSNGQDYKLLAQNPFPLSCQIAATDYPMLMDPKRSGSNCTGIAIYSKGAERW